MLDSRLAWYAVGASRSDVDSGSSVSLLHSIYGSQVSQLPFSDYESDASLFVTNSEYLPPTRANSPATLRRNRPKSSPASALAAREQNRRHSVGSIAQQRQPHVQNSRPASAAIQRQRPVSALVQNRGRLVRGNARRQSRPPSAAAASHHLRSGTGGGATTQSSRARPKTALGIRQQSSSSSVLLLDLEEEEEQERTPAPIIRDTPPVQLTRTPEYFDFWLGKPLQVRDYEVKVHKKEWKRPKSDYGNRFYARERDSAYDDGNDNSGQGGNVGLETLVEKDDSTIGSEGVNDKHKKSGDLDECDKDGNSVTNQDDSTLGDSSDVGGARQSSRRGSGDSEGSKAKGRGPVKKKFPNKKANSDSSNKQLFDRTKAAWSNEDGSRFAEQDDYFKSANIKKALSSVSWMDGGCSTAQKTTRFELPMDIQLLEGMSPLQYLRNHCIVSNHRMAHCSTIFTKLDKNKDARLELKELQAGLVEVHHFCITLEQVNSVLELVQLTNEMKVDLNLFAAICCLTERMLGLYYLPIARREVIELADFEALEWKLRTCTIDPSLRTLFAQL